MFQEETDDCVVELQNMVQSVAHSEAEIQHMINLLQDLESALNISKQRQEEVCSIKHPQKPKKCHHRKRYGEN